MINTNKQTTKNLWLKAKQIGNAVLGKVSILLFSILMLPPTPILHTTNILSSRSVNSLVVNTVNPACEMTSMVLAEYQAWHGLPSHHQPSPYISTDTVVIRGHIQEAMKRCIDGFVVNWYGRPSAGLPNDPDRDFIDRAFAELLRQAEVFEFKVAIMYDEGTLRNITSPYTGRVISDLRYAKKYFTSTSYLKINEQPALFIFPYEAPPNPIDAGIDWQTVRQQLGITVTLLDKDPDPSTPAHDALFDGFYAWVQPTGAWKPDGTEWGEGYLRWFYPTMADPPYNNKVAIGGVWPGFDDTLASWGSGRYIWRRCGQTWYDTWNIVKEYNPPIVMIETWNDFEEGTDVEYGIGECLTPSQNKCPSPGEQVVYIHTLANTGKFTDRFKVKVSSLSTWPTVTSFSNILLPGHASAPLVITLTVPEAASIGVQDRLSVTATSQLNVSVQNNLVNTAIVSCPVFLPIIFKAP
jgi:hypothetical protein